MAVARHTISQSLDNLKTCLDSQSWVTGTEIDSDVLYLLDEAGDQKIGISFPSSTSIKFKVKLADGNFYTTQDINGVTLDYAYSCASGILLNLQGTDQFGSAIITKNVLGHYALIGNSSNWYSMTSNVLALSTDDETPPNIFTFNQYTRKYTTLVSFNSETGGSPVSYTPFAYYVSFKNFTGSGYQVIELDGIRYLTNGYWALRDGSHQESERIEQTMIGIPPLSFKSDGTPLISWSMLGNGQQTGTPSPDNIIMPTFCGVRTANLAPPLTEWVDGYVGTNGIIATPSASYKEKSSDFLEIPTNAVTVVFSSEDGVFEGGTFGAWRAIGFYNSNKRFVSRVGGTGSSHTSAIPIPEGAKFMRVSCRTYESDKEYMLNLGSTAIPYEPYGYKIPLTCAGQTVPVYLGKVQTVRRIKKLVLTGEETFVATMSSTHYRCRTTPVPKGIAKSATSVLSTHYFASAGARDGAITLTTDGGSIYFTDDINAVTAETFKSYLAAQYAAGTPVTVWYVIAEPETAIVNEPLAKIGDYADELSSTDAAVTIPTVKGNNTLTVDTPIQPSRMTITYWKTDSQEGDLPSGYTRLECIINCLNPSGSGGRSGMELGYTPPADSLITSEIDLQYLSSGGSFFVYGVPSYPNPGYVYKYGNGYDSAGLSPTLPQDITVRHTIKLTTFSENEEYGSGRCIIRVGDSEHDWGNTPIAAKSIWALRDNNDTDASPACKLYSIKIYENEILVRDFVPCSNPLGKVGLYDLITQTFKSNANWIPG